MQFKEITVKISLVIFFVKVNGGFFAFTLNSFTIINDLIVLFLVGIIGVRTFFAVGKKENR